MIDGRFSVFKDFTKSLLERRGLQHPDDRSLYQYRLGTDEFNELEALLRKWLGMLGALELSDIIRLTGFPQLFVLYASEWWRRHYDGSGFRWEPILRDLGVNPDGWTPSQRSETVRTGLREWHLEIRGTGGLRFLGTVAVQGGLPLRLLSEARGGVGRLLYRVLELAQGRDVPAESIHGWVESLKGLLPKSYRQDAIYALLAGMVETALELKQEAGLSPGDNSVAVLDQKIPDWKERFPLVIESEHARALVEQLVQEAMRVQIRKVPPSLPVVRRLEQDLEGNWVLVSHVELPDLLEEKSLKRLFNLADEELPRMGKLSLHVAGKRFETRLRRLPGRSSYRMDLGDWQTHGSVSTLEHQLQLSVTDGRTWFAEVPSGEALDESLPWMFSAEQGNHILLRQGTGKVTESCVLLALPAGWHFGPSGEGSIERAGRLQEPDLPLYRIQGPVDVESPDGHVRKIRTGQTDSRKSYLHWGGDRVWLEFHNPTRAYRGMPQLYQSDDEGRKTRVNGVSLCKVLGAPHSNKPLGPATLRYPASGEYQIRTRMVLLPERADLKLYPEESRRGKLTFIGWGIQSVRITDPGIESNIQIDGNTLSLTVKAPSDIPTPRWLNLEIGWPHSTHFVGLKVPFPASGIRIFDSNGKELPNGAHLALHELPGMRVLVSTGGQFRRLALEICANRQHFVRRYPLRVAPDALSLELSLIDYLDDIQHLLSLDDSPDATLMLCFQSNGRELFHVKVARYTASMSRDHDQLILKGQETDDIDEEMLESLPVLAARLEFPQDEPLALEPVASEGVTAAAWRFHPSQREPGTWFLYPGTDANIPFRACIWPVEGEVEIQDVLLRATHLKVQDERDLAIMETVEALAEDFLHPSWATLEQLARQFGHLTLATLDIWRQFSRNRTGMAALALRLGNLPKSFHLRFARELPFAWEAVSASAWRKAITNLKIQCEQKYGTLGQTIFLRHLDECRKTLCVECASLDYVLGITSAEFSDEDTRQAQLLKQVGEGLANELFQGEKSPLMRLRQFHANDTWPGERSRLLDKAQQNSLIRPFLYSDGLRHRDGVINLPLIAAAACAQGQSDEYFRDPEAIHLLRTCRIFDPEWFEEAYNRTIAHCYTVGLFDV